MQTKDSIRRAILEKRLALDPGQKQGMSKLICERLKALPVFQDAVHILSYAAIQSEVDPFHLWELKRSDQVLYFPRVSGEDLIIHQVDSAEQLKPGSYGVPEPDPQECPEVEYHDFDLVLVPGIVFGRSDGHRLGYGKGYYDRFLVTCRGYRMGLAFGFQVLESVPDEGHDQTLDAVLTERVFYEPGIVE